VQVVPWTEAQQASRYVISEIHAENVRDPVRAFAEETGAGIVISGAYYRRGETVQYQVEVIDATRGDPLGTLDPVTAPLESPDEVIELLRERVMGLLAVAFDERLTTAEVVARKPPTFDAYRAFDRGLQLYLESAGYNRDAIPHLREAAEIDTTFLTPLIYAALVFWNNRDMRETDSLIGMLEGDYDRLSDYDRAWVEYIRGAVEGDREQQLRAMRRASELAPGSKAVYNRALVAAYLNRPQEALDALLSLDPERGPMRGFAAYFSPLRRAYALLGDHEGELRAATRQRELYTDVAGRAWALGCQAWALAALDRVDEVNALLDELDFGPTDGVRQSDGLIHGQVLLLTAARLRIHGHAEAAQATADRAIRWFEGKPAQIVEFRAWRWSYAEALYVGGRWNEAYDILRQLSEDSPQNVKYQGFLGVAAARLGDHATAERVYQRLEGKDHRFGRSTGWQAQIAAVMGDREKAVQRLADAFSQSFPQNPHMWLWIDFESLRGYEPFDELMRPKG
jgi:tetratricopeptide (TPR) repeat protein